MNSASLFSDNNLTGLTSSILFPFIDGECIINGESAKINTCLFVVSYLCLKVQGTAPNLQVGFSTRQSEEAISGSRFWVL